MEKTSKSKTEYAQNAPKNRANDIHTELGLKPEQSLDLLKELHILTRDGRINQDSRRKFKQVQHLLQFIVPLLEKTLAKQERLSLVDHGSGKSYLGFMLYDAFFKTRSQSSEVIGVEIRADLVEKSTMLAKQFGFAGMRFVQSSVADSEKQLPTDIDVVTALHACDTATDDAIGFALKHHAKHIVLVPCCQAEIAMELRSQKQSSLHSNPLAELWRRPLHTREFGSQLTNVLRSLQLEAHGYEVSVTELVGWEHSMKNEIIIASKGQPHAKTAAKRLNELLVQTGLDGMKNRFFTPLLNPEHG